MVWLDGSFDTVHFIIDDCPLFCDRIQMDCDAITLKIVDKNTNVDKLKDTEKAISNQNIGWILVPVALDRRKRSIDDKKSNLKRLSHSVHVQSDIRYR